jgi:hypothetical protein
MRAVLSSGVDRIARKGAATKSVRVAAENENPMKRAIYTVDDYKQDWEPYLAYRLIRDDE